LQWEGRVHECVTQWLKAGNKRVLEIPVAILHLGNAQDVVEAKDKLNRNLTLLKRRCTEEPENPVMWSHLARVTLRANQPEEAWAAAQKGWAALMVARNEGNCSHSVAPLVTVYAFLALQRDSAQVALEVLRLAESWGVQHPNLALLQGVTFETLALSNGPDREAQLDASAQAFDQAIQMGSQTWTEDSMPGATGWAAYTRLGTIRLLQDRWSEARQAFSRALDEQPTNTEAGLGLVESFLGENQPALALQLVEPLLQLNGADAWILCAFASRNLGEVEDCRLFLKLASQRIEEGLYAPHRRVYLEQLQQDLAAMAG
jgi:tetratricopeptide (TPR) repeat protein